MTIVIVLFSLVLGLAIPAVVFFFIFKMVKGRSDKIARLRAYGVRTDARILQLSQPNMHINGSPMIPMSLEVRGPTGPFVVQAEILVPSIAMARVQPGMSVPVLYNPQNPAELEIAFSEMGYR